MDKIIGDVKKAAIPLSKSNVTSKCSFGIQLFYSNDLACKIDL